MRTDYICQTGLNAILTSDSSRMYIFYTYFSGTFAISISFLTRNNKMNALCLFLRTEISRDNYCEVDVPLRAYAPSFN